MQIWRQLNYTLLLISIWAENSSLVYGSLLGVEGEFKHFTERQYFVLVWIYTFQKKKEAYVYGKEHTTCNEKLKYHVRIWIHLFGKPPSYVLILSSFLIRTTVGCIKLNLNWCIYLHVESHSYTYTMCTLPIAAT